MILVSNPRICSSSSESSLTEQGEHVSTTWKHLWKNWNGRNEFMSIQRSIRLCRRNDFYSRQKKPIFDHMKSLLITRNQFILKIDSCDKNVFLFLSQKNQLFSQEINSGHKKSYLVSSHPSLKFMNSRQRVSSNKKFAWAYTFCGTLVPRFLVNLLSWETLETPWKNLLNNLHTFLKPVWTNLETCF